MTRATHRPAMRLWLAVAAWRHGWAWPLAAGLALAALALHLGVLPGAREQLRLARAELAAARAGDTATPAPPPVADDVRRILAAQAAVRAAPDPTEQVARMARLADAKQLALPRGDYLYQSTPAGTATQAGVIHVQVTQPLRASYAQVRRYAEAVLRETPNAALDQIVVSREGVEQAQVEARLKWSLWIPSDRAPTRTPAPSPPPRDLFAAHSWAPPPAPPPPPAVAAPTAPPPPYTYIGKKLENGEWEVYLARGEQTFAARPGATLETAWRVDAIAPPVMTLTYLPLGQAQTLPIGDNR